MNTRRSKIRRLPGPAAPAAADAPMRLTPDQASAFFADLFIRLNRHMATAPSLAQKLMILQEARQYLHGARALWAYARPEPAAPGQAVQPPGAGPVMDGLFLDADAYLTEVESQLDPRRIYPAPS